ncbi:MAG: glycosyltransferase family 4 protein [Solirubrobacterales bacterium]|nr:glycosyltransferase family 4 protein [Solirubrobacterales bacterium]
MTDHSIQMVERTQLPERIGLNLLYLVPGAVGGSEIFARELIHQLGAQLPEHELIVFSVREATESLDAEGWPANVTIQEVPIDGANKPLRAFTEMLRLPRIAKQAGVGLLHSLGNTAPRWGDHARVVSILDLIFHHHPETFPGPARLGLEVLVPMGAKHSDRVIAISQATKDDLVDSFGVNADKVDVVHLGIGQTQQSTTVPPEELRRRYEFGERPILLCVASALAHKNIPRLFRAFAGRFPDAPNAPALVVVGHAGLEQDNLRALASSLGVADRVRFTGWIEQDELEGLYAAAAVFVYPTLREGFGLPVLEAMARGVPVACSNTSSLPEVAGDAAELFDPTDTDAVGDAVARILDSRELHESLIARGREQAARFTWERSAAETIESYRTAMRAHNQS